MIESVVLGGIETTASIPQRGSSTATADIHRLAGDWQQLRERLRIVAPYSDWGRFWAVTATLQNAQAHLAIWKRGATPCAGILGRIRRRRNTHRLGYFEANGPGLKTLEIVYGGLACPDAGCAQRLCDHLAELLSGEVDQISINHLPADSTLYGIIRSHPLLGRMLVELVREPHWVLELEPGPFENTLRKFSKKRRNALRREARRLAERFDGDLQVQLLSAPGELDLMFEWAVSIVENTYHAALRAGFRDNALWREQLALEAKRGCLRAFFLLGSGKPFAFNIGSVYSDCLVLDALAHLPEYSRYSPGKHLLLQLFEQCAAESIRCVDYGFGDAEYKRVYGTRCWDESILRIYGPSWRARLDRYGSRTSRLVGDVLRKLPASKRLLKRMKRAWRDRLTEAQQKR